MEGVPPSFMEDDVNQLDLETFNTSELLLSPPEEVPVNQSSISCNDQAGQNLLVNINDTIQQTTRFPPSFPQTMMEEVLPSSMDDDFNRLQLEKLLSGLPSSPREEVLANQSSIFPSNDQAVQNILMVNDVDTIQQTTQFPTPFPDQTMTAIRGLDGTSSSWINQNVPNWLQTPSSDQQWTNQLPMSNQVPGMLPQPPMSQCSQQFPYQFNQVPITPNPYDPQSSTMLPEPSQTLRHQNSFIHQPQPGHVYMTQNATTSQHDGFNQPTPWIQCIPNQGQVDQASVIPHIDNMQQESLVPRNVGRSTRSQMENLQVHVLQNQIGWPNASNAGLNSSLQSQNRGLNTQQVQRAGSRDPFWNYVEEKDNGSMICRFCRRRWDSKIPISRFKWHLSGEDRRGVAICRRVTKEVQEEALKAMHGGNKRHKSTASSINVNDHGISTCQQEQNIENENIGGDIGRLLREVQVVEAGVGDKRISSHAVAGNDVVSMTGMGAQEDRVSEGALESRLRIQLVDRALEQSNLAGTAGRTHGAGEERIQSHSQAENAMEDTGEGSFGHDAFQTIPRTQQVQHLDRGSSCERPSINQVDEPRGDSSQPSDPLCLDHGRYYDQPFAPSVSNDVIMNDVQNIVRVRTEPVEEHNVENSGRLVQPDVGARSSRILKDNISETRGVPFPISRLIGQAVEENIKVIWSLLMDDEVSTIGIYRMGGVGKTTLLQYIHNELLRRPDICDHVWWVTVSQDFTIKRLQNLIAKHLHLDLSSEDADSDRAAKLSEELRKKQKWILILDDLWNSFEPHEVGIHSFLKGCKLILITRSQTVCHQIACEHKIKVKPLFEGEAWTLFRENLLHHMELSPEVVGVAKDVARKCAGLPLGIITVARSLRGVDNLNKWRNTLKEMRASRYRDMDYKVFRVLRFSYDRLDDGLALQKCLLYCALFPEDDWISINELIGYLIDEGIIKGMTSRQDAFDEGHTILNELEYVCLLESDCNYVKMHDLIRDMAIQIMQENSQVIVKAGAQLEELPDAEEWTENLTRVSLMKNQIKEIPPSHSPMCPNLSTLFLCDNRQLGFIADSFFKQLHGLRVLDLSRTGIVKLPDSVSDLVSLTVLLLIECLRLRYVPSLEKLKALKRLDLSKTRLEKMPQGMQCLTKLRYLRMNGCGEKEFPRGILPKISDLQVLLLENIDEGYPVITVEGRDVGCLGKLETLECHFEGLSDFAEYLRSQNGIRSLRTCRISVGTMNKCYFGDTPSKRVWLGNCNIDAYIDIEVKFLNGIQGLHCESFDARSLCDVLSLENATELEIINIENCDSMESLVSSSWFFSATRPLSSHNGMFSRLKEFHCDRCNSMEKLFPVELLSYLVNLEVISVLDCEKMEEIIGATDEESNTSNPIAELTLPKLTTLQLLELPELKGICSAKLICNSLEVIDVTNCTKLKRMAISLPLLENGQPYPHPSLKRIEAYPKYWWDTVVEWEPPNAKEVLHPIVHFEVLHPRGVDCSALNIIYVEE